LLLPQSLQLHSELSLLDLVIGENLNVMVSSQSYGE